LDPNAISYCGGGIYLQNLKWDIFLNNHEKIKININIKNG
jgi:hypothetical protein